MAVPPPPLPRAGEARQANPDASATKTCTYEMPYYCILKLLDMKDTELLDFIRLGEI